MALLALLVVGVTSQPATAQDSPAPAPASQDPAARFDELESRLLARTALCLGFHITSEGAVLSDLRGVFELGPGGVTRLGADGSFAGGTIQLHLRAAEGEYAYGNAATSTTAPVPPHLREALLIGMTRMGLLHNLAMLSGGAPPDRADGGVREWTTVSSVAEDADALTFDLTVSGEPAGVVRLQLDADGLPAQRWQTVMFPEGEMRVIERYTACSEPAAVERAPAPATGPQR
jgi:hypothetical protein